jgi:hypothetical protein
MGILGHLPNGTFASYDLASNDYYRCTISKSSSYTLQISVSHFVSRFLANLISIYAHVLNIGNMDHNLPDTTYGFCGRHRSDLTVHPIGIAPTGFCNRLTLPLLRYIGLLDHLWPCRYLRPILTGNCTAASLELSHPSWSHWNLLPHNWWHCTLTTLVLSSTRLSPPFIAFCHTSCCSLPPTDLPPHRLNRSSLSRGYPRSTPLNMCGLSLPRLERRRRLGKLEEYDETQT